MSKKHSKAQRFFNKHLLAQKLDEKTVVWALEEFLENHKKKLRKLIGINNV